MLGTNKSRKVVEAALVAKYANLWRFALALSGDATTADDLVQATSMRALEKANQLVDTSKPLAWLFAICRSIWLNQMRSDKIRAAQSLETAPDVALISTNSSVEANIFAAEVFTEVMRLPEAQRETVMLVYVEGFSYREAAATLDIPLGTVMSRLSAARAKLARLNSDEQSPSVGLEQ